LKFDDAPRQPPRPGLTQNGTGQTLAHGDRALRDPWLPASFPALDTMPDRQPRSRWIHDETGNLHPRASCYGPSRSIGAQMTAVIYNFSRPAEGSPIDETERLFSALGRYTAAELLELLYVGEEPGFFELIRGIFGLSDESRLILQNFLAAMPPHSITVTIDPRGRCILTHDTSVPQENPGKGIAH
jgi:hypothetical protein